MTDWLFWPLLCGGLLAAGFLLVRHGVIDPQDAVAGGVLVGVIAGAWRFLRGGPDTTKGAQHPLAPGENEPKPQPPTDDAQAIIDESEDRLQDRPPDDVHDQLHDLLDDRLNRE